MKITLNSVTTIPAGVALRLSPEQSASRAHLLEAFGKQKGVVVGVTALQFKAGESVEVVGDLPKGILPIYDQLKAAADRAPSVTNNASS